MEKRYRIIISGKQLYKEIEISPEHKSLRFGTGLNCDVRVRRGLFFEPVESDMAGPSSSCDHARGDTTFEVRTCPPAWAEAGTVTAITASIG